MTTADRAPRLLIADDDVDVLAALKLLLRGEGYELETALAFGALEAREFDAALLDLNCSARHDVGPRGARPAGAHPLARPYAAGDRDDRVGREEDLASGLRVIESRAQALGRFMRACRSPRWRRCASRRRWNALAPRETSAQR